MIFFYIYILSLLKPLIVLFPTQSLMSTTAFGLGSKYFALYEVAGVGIQWKTLSQSPVEGDDFNLMLSMMMLVIDAVVYGVLTWYIEAVHPGKHWACCQVLYLGYILCFSFCVFLLVRSRK